MERLKSFKKGLKIAKKNGHDLEDVKSFEGLDIWFCKNKECGASVFKDLKTKFVSGSALEVKCEDHRTKRGLGYTEVTTKGIGYKGMFKENYT